MKRYRYAGTDHGGKPISGVIAALSPLSAESKLRLSGYTILVIEELHEAETSSSSIPLPPPPPMPEVPSSWAPDPRISGKEPPVSLPPPPPLGSSGPEPSQVPPRDPVVAEPPPPRQARPDRAQPSPPPVEPRKQPEAPALRIEPPPRPRPRQEPEPRTRPAPRKSKPSPPPSTAPTDQARSQRKAGGSPPGRKGRSTQPRPGRQSAARTVAPEPRRPIDGLYRPNLRERAATWRVPRRQLYVVFGLLALIGFLVMFVQAQSRHAPAVNQAARYHPVSLVFEGTLELPADADRGRTRLTIVLPQIPLDLERSVDQLDLKPDGRFRVAFSFQSRTVPTDCDVTLTSPGYDPVRQSHLSLSGRPSICHLGRLVLRPASRP